MFTLNGKKVDPKYKVPYNIEPMPLYKNQQIKIVAIAAKENQKIMLNLNVEIHHLKLMMIKMYLIFGLNHIKISNT